MEYTVLLCVVLSALLIMQFYVKRAYQGRIKQEADSVGTQYAPGHTNATVVTNTTVNTTTYVGGVTETGVTVDNGVSVSASSTNNTFTKDEAIAPLYRDVNGTGP